LHPVGARVPAVVQSQDAERDALTRERG
jgi:hypothetical protein